MARLFWIVLLVFHVAAIPASWVTLCDTWSGEQWGGPAFRSLGLALSTLFFVLKVVDVGWLRLMPGWRSAVSMMMVVALIHVPVLQDGGIEKLPDRCVGLATACLLGAVLEQDQATRGAWTKFQRRLIDAIHADDPKWSARIGRSWERTLEPHVFGFILACLGPRPPPHSIS